MISRVRPSSRPFRRPGQTASPCPAPPKILPRPIGSGAAVATPSATRGRRFGARPGPGGRRAGGGGGDAFVGGTNDASALARYNAGGRSTRRSTSLEGRCPRSTPVARGSVKGRLPSGGEFICHASRFQYWTHPVFDIPLFDIQRDGSGHDSDSTRPCGPLQTSWDVGGGEKAVRRSSTSTALSVRLAAPARA